MLVAAARARNFTLHFSRFVIILHVHRQILLDNFEYYFANNCSKLTTMTKYLGGALEVIDKVKRCYEFGESVLQRFSFSTEIVHFALICILYQRMKKFWYG